MFSWETAPLDARTTRHRLQLGGEPATWRDTAAWLCADDPALRRSLTAVLAASACEAFYWETPGVKADRVDAAFEMVIVDAPGLRSHRATPEAFAAYLGPGPASVRCFANLAGDARLIAPCPLGAHEHYGHLARFVRGAPADQIDALWRSVGEALRGWWATRAASVWLSTSGGGVPWLHVRLDPRPKYYAHAPYRRAP